MARDAEESDGILDRKNPGKSLSLLPYFHNKYRVKLSKIREVERNNIQEIKELRFQELSSLTNVENQIPK